MGPMVIFLLSIGLRLDWATWAQMDILPRPTLWFVSSPVVPKGADVTLRCQGQLGTERIQLWKDNKLREERIVSWEPAEFILKNVSDLKNAKSYRCRSGQKSLWSELSHPLTLVVITGTFPKPSIGVTYSSSITQGRTVTIWCHVPPQAPSQDYSVALLEAKSLEPLQTQSPEGLRAHFSVLSVNPKDSGSYSCIYYRKAFPHIGSYPSKTLELGLSGKFPKPTLWALSGLMMPQGSNITLWCSRPKLSALGEVTFTLWKAGTPQVFQHQSSTQLWTSFTLPSVRLEDTGSYSCDYRERIKPKRGSESSDALELVVLGSLPRPSLSALPGLVVEPGTHVTLQCRLPPETFLSDVTFSLLKMGSPQPLQSQTLGGTSADFPLLSVRAQDSGNYSCAYYVRMPSYQGSESSDVLEIWVTDALPKPSLSAWSGSEVISGASLTFLCWGPPWVSKFLLYKERNERILPTKDIPHVGTQFVLTLVAPEHSGNYSCSYQLNTNGSLWTQHSDPVQLIVRGSLLSHIFIITLTCISFFLLLCLLFLAFLYQESICKGCLKGDSPTRNLSCPCMSHHPEVPTEEALNTDEAKKRSRPSLSPMAEDIIYTQLSMTTLNKRKSDPKKTPTEPILYSTMSLN